MDTKICTLCKQTKPLAQFSQNRYAKDGLRCWCKTCCSIAYREQYRANPEKTLVRTREYRKNNRAKACALTNKWRQANPEKVYIYNVKANLRHPEKISARKAVHAAIKSARLPRIETLRCVRCGQQAHEYHHHKGYAKEHWLDVVPVCIKCHYILDHETK